MVKQERKDRREPDKTPRSGRRDLVRDPARPGRRRDPTELPASEPLPPPANG